MKKLVKEILNERIGNQNYYDKEKIDRKEGIIAKIKKYCESTINSCQETNDEYSKVDFDNLDDEERESLINNEGRIAVCEEILSIISIR